MLHRLFYLLSVCYQLPHGNKYHHFLSTRAADNFIYLASAFRGGGSRLFDPKGEIIAEGNGPPDALIAADIDLAAGREAGDALGGTTADFRARLFRERHPAAYGILLEENPPGLQRLRHVEVPSIEQAAALFAEGLTTGATAFYEAEHWLEQGKTELAQQRFTELAQHFGRVWIGRVARQRLAHIAAGEAQSLM